MTYCTNCGSEVPTGAAFCGECGVAVDDEGPANKPRAPSQTPGARAVSRRSAGSGGRISTALTYPMNRDDAILNPLIIGSLLNLFSVLLFPVIFLIGYGMEVFRNVAKGDPEPPTFGHWGRLFGDGLKGTVLVLIYFGVPSVILFLLLVISTPDQSTTVATEPGTGAVFGAFVISLPLFLVGGYFFPAAFGGVARSGRLGSGFDFAGILDATLSGKYFVGWLRAFVVYMVFLMVIAFLFAMNIIPILGTVIFLFGVFIFQFYLLVSITYVFARAYAESLRLVSKYPRQAEQGPMPSASDRGGTK